MDYGQVNKIHIFTGHYGSGKTEIALNFAIKNAKMGYKTVIVDLDIVNPYFRTNDVHDILQQNGIKVIAPLFANTNLDIPALPGDVMSVFNMKDTVRIFDVGGDDDGAYALGQYKRFFDVSPYRMYFVANSKRPLTSTYEEMNDIFDRIEAASRIKFTDIINNTHLSNETDESVILSGIEQINKLAEEKKLKVTAHCASSDIANRLKEKGFKNIFEIQTYLKKPWE